MNENPGITLIYPKKILLRYPDRKDITSLGLGEEDTFILDYFFSDSSYSEVEISKFIQPYFQNYYDIFDVLDMLVDKGAIFTTTINGENRYFLATSNNS